MFLQYKDMTAFLKFNDDRVGYVWYNYHVILITISCFALGKTSIDLFHERLPWKPKLLFYFYKNFVCVISKLSSISL